MTAGNREIVATGESHETKAGVKDGIQAVKRAATNATTDDKTG